MILGVSFRSDTKAVAILGPVLRLNRLGGIVGKISHPALDHVELPLGHGEPTPSVLYIFTGVRRFHDAGVEFFEQFFLRRNLLQIIPRSHQTLELCLGFLPLHFVGRSHARFRPFPGSIQISLRFDNLLLRIRHLLLRAGGSHCSCRCANRRRKKKRCRNTKHDDCLHESLLVDDVHHANHPKPIPCLQYPLTSRKQFSAGLRRTRTL